MSDEEDLACRYLSLWQNYLTALIADPKEPSFREFWIAACAALAGAPLPREPVDPTRPTGSSPSAASATGASLERGDAVANLASRLASVEDRIAALERRRQATARPRGRDRRGRN